MIAALYVQHGGCYWDLPGVDAWDEARDARLYAGPWPVVAHPPCSSWCKLAPINQKRYGHQVGDDGGCFESALNSVRLWGGVLEHPAYSLAWQRFSLSRPNRAGWQYDDRTDGWVCEVAQSAYGHRAKKRTWLYYHGQNSPPVLDWRKPRGTAQVSYCANHGASDLPRLTKKQAKATPFAFRDALLSIARATRKERAA